MSLFPMPITPMPDFIPDHIASRIGGKRYQLARIPAVIRRRMRTPEKIKVSEHAAKYRVVTEAPHDGPWRHDLSPHTVKIMDTFSLPWVREIWFCGVEQSGKTNTMLNCLHWAADVDPGDIYYLMPTEDTSAKVTAGKIIPMVKASKKLAKYLTGKTDDATLSRIKLSHGVTIRPAHANSPSSMATFAAKHCFGDEVDKFPERAGQEADPITLIKKRNRLYKGRYKRFFASTPAGRFIYNGMLACMQVWEHRLYCPHCHELIKMDGEHLVLPEGIEADAIDSSTEISYVCNHCDSIWSDLDRDRAIRAGRWVCIKGDVARPTRVGFHHRAWECLDVPLYEIAAAWLRAETGSVADKVAWANGYEAVDYVHEQKDREEDYILRLRDQERPRGVVPANTYSLVILVDTQRLGFHYQVWAYHWGRDLSVSIIDNGFLESFTALKDLAAKSYQDAEGKDYRCQVGFIDSGGGTNPEKPKHSRTVEVYEFCRRNPLFRPLKGRRTMEAGWNVKRMDFYPSSVGKKIPIPGGLNLYTINVTLWKDELDRKLQIEPGDAGGFTLHAAVGKEWAKQLCAEYRDERGYWQCPKGKDNHHWDICVYGLALADIIGVRNKRKTAGTTVKVKKTGGGFVNNY